MSYTDRSTRNLHHLKADRTALGTGAPGKHEGADGDQRVSYIQGEGLRLYIKRNNEWHYTSLSTRENKDIASATQIGMIKVGTGLSITTDGILSATVSDTNNYITGISGNGDSTITITREGLADITHSLAHSHSEYITGISNEDTVGEGLVADTTGSIYRLKGGDNITIGQEGNSTDTWVEIDCDINTSNYLPTSTARWANIKTFDTDAFVDTHSAGAGDSLILDHDNSNVALTTGTVTDGGGTTYNAIRLNTPTIQYTSAITLSELQTTIGTGNSKLVPAQGSSGDFLYYNGTWASLPIYMPSGTQGGVSTGVAHTDDSYDINNPSANGFQSEFLRKDGIWSSIPATSDTFDRFTNIRADNLTPETTPSVLTAGTTSDELNLEGGSGITTNATQSGSVVKVTISANWGNGNTDVARGDHTHSNYLTSETSHADVLVDGDFSSAGLMKTNGSGTYSIITDNSDDWDTAHSWGDHDGLYDNYNDWDLFVGGVEKSSVTSGKNVNFQKTALITPEDANGTGLTISFTEESNPQLSTVYFTDKNVFASLSAPASNKIPFYKHSANAGASTVGWITLDSSLSLSASGTLSASLSSVNRFTSINADNITNPMNILDASGTGDTLNFVGSGGTTTSASQSGSVVTVTVSSSSSVGWNDVTGKPTTFAPASHTHSYLPLSGGTLTGATVLDLDSSQSTGLHISSANTSYTQRMLYLTKYGQGASANYSYIKVYNATDVSVPFEVKGDGTTTLGGSLTGTSASFSGNVKIGSPTGSPLTSDYLQIWGDDNATASKEMLRANSSNHGSYRFQLMHDAVDSSDYGGDVRDIVFQGVNVGFHHVAEGSIKFSTYNGGWQRALTIDTSQNATFSGAVDSPLVKSNDIRAKGSGGISFQNSSGVKSFEIVDSGATLSVYKNATFSGQVEGSQFYTGGLLIRANNDTYASMRVTGNTRNGYEGIKFNSGNKIMMNETLGSACGFYNNSHGWSILSYTTGAVNLYYSASQRLSTTSGGVAITGALTATGDITAYYSDARLKTDVREIDKPLEKLQKIRGVHFKWNDEEINVVRKRSGTNDVGLIAQEVESVLPDLVFEYDQDLEDMGDMNGKKQAEYAKNPVPRMSPKYKTIKYDKLTALLVEGSKELIIKDNEQDLEIKRLQDRVKYLEAQIGES